MLSARVAFRHTPARTIARDFATHGAAWAVALLAVASGVAGCSSSAGSAAPINPPTASPVRPAATPSADPFAGPAIPVDCQASDYDGNAYASTGRPECGWIAERYDFSKKDVMVDRLESRVLALPALTASGDLDRGKGLTPLQWVQQQSARVTSDALTAETIPGTSYAYADYLTTSDFGASIAGQELDVKEAKVYTLAELAANQESGGSSPVPVTFGAGTVSVEFTKQSPLQGASAGVFAVTFAGPPTQTNGTVSGNTVHWTLTGHESAPYIYATGPTA